MMRYPLQLHIFLIPIVFALYNAPPTIISPENLDDPKELVKLGAQTGKEISFICKVRNAEHVEWQFSSSLEGSLGDVPSTIEQRSVNKDGDTLSRILTNQDEDQRQLYLLNGYYRCIATNSLGFTIESPPIPLFIQVLEYHNGKDILPRAASGYEKSPYMMQCVDDLVVRKPDNLLDLNTVQFSWMTSNPLKYQKVEESSRIKINKKTGDLYFAYLEADDGFGTKPDDNEYQCSARSPNMLNFLIVGRHKLDVLSKIGNPDGPRVVYPSTSAQKTVTCVDGSNCILTCIYGGSDWEMKIDPPDPTWTLPPEAEGQMAQPQPGITIEFLAFPAAQGVWTCGGGEWPSVNITVIVQMYPKILEHDMVDQFVPVGTDVEFYCDAQYADKIKFYFNGQHVTEGKPPYVQHKAGSQVMRIANAQRNHSSSVTCLAFNGAGVAYKAAELNVYKKPNISLTPEGGIYLTNSDNGTDLTNIFFECSALLDEKVLKADIYWRSNHSDVGSEKLRGRHPVSIRVVNTIYEQQYIESRLRFDLDVETQSTLAGAIWWCVVEMLFAERDEAVEAHSEAIPFGTAEVNIDRSITPKRFDDWWLVGVIVAFCFFVLIIILIVCCVRHHKGEEYYVDEKERRAGHKPEEEMGLYGFSDYKRPETGGYMPMTMSDQDPVKGSRTSLDRSDKPLDSDSEGMDEYGDIDPGRFNEDGSFIGQYGKASSPMAV